MPHWVQTIRRANVEDIQQNMQWLLHEELATKALRAGTNKQKERYNLKYNE